jgi:hypothetical protein
LIFNYATAEKIKRGKKYMTYTKKEREQYNKQRDRIIEKLGIDKNDYNYFRKKGEELHKLYEQDCNGEVAEKRYDKIEKQLMTRINTRLKKIKKEKGLTLYVYIQGDPRGATIYLDNIEIPANNYTMAECIF